MQTGNLSLGKEKHPRSGRSVQLQALQGGAPGSGSTRRGREAVPPAESQMTPRRVWDLLCDTWDRWRDAGCWPLAEVSCCCSQVAGADFFAELFSFQALEHYPWRRRKPETGQRNPGGLEACSPLC